VDLTLSDGACNRVVRNLSDFLEI